MGRIKSTPVKNLARDIVSEHGDRFTTDFDKNKTIIKEVKKIKSKKIRNVVAGYVTKQTASKKKNSG